MCFDNSEVLNWGQNPCCKSKEIDWSNDHGTYLWILFILTYFLKINIPTWWPWWSILNLDVWCTKASQTSLMQLTSTFHWANQIFFVCCAYSYSRMNHTLWFCILTWDLCMIPLGLTFENYLNILKRWTSFHSN